ncbi:type II toxin-antitoxin system RelE/ParE family toxin [Algoriphagus aquimarinus]|uniref:type II toxin-antitoxin system RelE/ParE family toxin n=1 Tax=Algoriphagus aquimarinus TaxID=237018 RepID=UPI0030D93117|tara:strand:+ start:50267 stop:50575 length:309 start_codon:yes stop_codon:yes gene_type:complete
MIVYWTQFAEDKLQDIYRFYSEVATEKIAFKLVNGIVETTINLSENPDLGPIEQLLIERDQNFRSLIYKKYKIIYWVNLEFNRIEIANVFDCRQNPEMIKKF